MDEEKVALHVERIRRALEKNGKHVDENEIRKAYLTQRISYGLSERKSEENVLEGYGVDPSSLESGQPAKVSDLVPNYTVNITGRVVSINRAVVNRDGEELTKFYGILRDDTGSVPFSTWRPSLMEGIEKGDDVEFRGAFVTEWDGKPQLKLGKSASVHKVELDYEIPVSGRGSSGPADEVKLSEVAPGRRIAFTARVMSVEERKITAKGEEKTIYSGILADETGKVQFTAWKDFGLLPGDVIKVNGAYVREWRGTPQINLDDGMDVEKVDIDFPSMEELDRGTPIRVWEAEKRGSVNDALIRATVIQVKPGSGLIFRCPECRWVLQDGVCKKHGKVDGVPDLRIKAVIDDGTGSLNIVAGKEISSAILGKSVEECVKEAQEKMDRSVIFRELEEKILARDVEVRGNVLTDDMSSTLIVSEMKIAEEDPVKMAEELIEEWGV